MHRCVLLLAVASSLPALAEEALPLNAVPASAPIAAEHPELAALRQERDLLKAELAEQGQLRESAQVSRLRQENQRLKLQLKSAQAGQPQGLLSEQQSWFGLGALLALAGVVVGRLSARGRSRKQWLN